MFEKLKAFFAKKPARSPDKDKTYMFVQEGEKLPTIVLPNGKKCNLNKFSKNNQSVLEASETDYHCESDYHGNTIKRTSPKFCVNHYSLTSKGKLFSADSCGRSYNRKHWGTDKEWRVCLVQKIVLEDEIKRNKVYEAYQEKYGEPVLIPSYSGDEPGLLITTMNGAYINDDRAMTEYEFKSAKKDFNKVKERQETNANRHSEYDFEKAKEYFNNSKAQQELNKTDKQQEANETDERQESNILSPQSIRKIHLSSQRSDELRGILSPCQEDFHFSNKERQNNNTPTLLPKDKTR